MKKARRIYEPWIEKENTFKEIPEIFKENYGERLNFSYLLKIPAQHKSNPFLLGVYDDFLYVLEDAKDGVKKEKIHYRDIECIRHTEVLLSGRMEFIAGGKEIAIDYNTVSSEVIEELIDSIRGKYLSGNKPVYFEEIEEAQGENLDHIFLSLISKFREKGDKLKYIASQNDAPMSVSEKNSLKKLFFKFFNSGELKSSVYFSNNSEIVVIEKGEALKPKKNGTYGFSISYLPIEKISSVVIKPHRFYGSTFELEINFSEKNSKFLFEESNKSKEILIDYVERRISDLNCVR